ncbi:hypothetical protein ED733_000352 [Metarhizium rileyi]|uniref:Protein kinase-like domain protein n=1 Tax=Metarhizium rileyi (strain RCEF 4871) TaxID=1649241 RepID=A0A5C6FY75_METRR|nr:hypothetical protein ED733_000352 [Metarhizium rileyi]
MSTPPCIVPSEDIDDILHKLEREQVRQWTTDREATPEAIFRTDAKHSYKLECELLHRKYKDDEIDIIRLGIANSTYWQKDANFAAHGFLNALLANLRDKYTSDGVTDFRGMSIELRRLSEEQGQSSQKFRRHRDSITDEQYWEMEAEHLRLESARREFEARQQLRSDFEAIPSPALRESDNGVRGSTPKYPHSRGTVPSVNSRYAPQGGDHFLLAAPRLCPSTLRSTHFFNYVEKSGLLKLAKETAGNDDMPDADILGLKNNCFYEFKPPNPEEDPQSGWKGGQLFNSTGQLYCFVFGENIHAPHGWVMGSSLADSCDFRLAVDNRGGVSREHLRIDISPDDHCNPRVNNLSRNPIRVWHGNRLVVLATREHTDITEPVRIDIGDLIIPAWRPTLSLDEMKQFKKYGKRFHHDYMRAVPRPSEVYLMAKTPDIRLGMGGRMYKRAEDFHASSGSFASVIKVEELKSKRVFAAKIPHYRQSDSIAMARMRWELLVNEFRRLIELRHTNIVQAVEILPGRTLNEPPCLIMEWIPRDLRSISLKDD